MTLHLRLSLAAAALLATTFALAPRPASAAGAAYCTAQSSANGEAAYVGNCIYSDYQQCLAAVASTRGNCVANVEYRGGSEADTASRRRLNR